MEYIAFDAHKRYTLASVARPDGGLVREQRIPHERGALEEFLGRCERGSPVAVETIGLLVIGAFWAGGWLIGDDPDPRRPLRRVGSSARVRAVLAEEMPRSRFARV